MHSISLFFDENNEISIKAVQKAKKRESCHEEHVYSRSRSPHPCSSVFEQTDEKQKLRLEVGEGCCRGWSCVCVHARACVR